MRLRVVKQLALTTLREFIRSREAVFWTYGFPVLMAVILGVAFSRDRPAPLRVALAGATASAELGAVLRADAVLGADAVLRVVERTAEQARAELADGEVDLVVGGDAERPLLRFDPARQESTLARLQVEAALQRAAGRRDVVEVAAEPLPAEGEHGSATRYIDLLIPGLVGLNLVGAGLWGIGFNIVDMRAKYLLRRLLVAPMLRVEFLAALLLSRLGLVVFDALLILAFGMLAFDVPMRGSWLLLLALLALMGIAFSGLGLLVASRPRTVEGVSGLMNLVMMPMWLLCGSFFKTSYFPDYLDPLIYALPLTHANDALRAVMLQGHGLAEIWPQVTYLAVFAAATFAVALRVFRWV